VTSRQVSGCSVFITDRRRGQIFLACEIMTYAGQEDSIAGEEKRT
jgi:hypothetical protein